MKRILLIGVFAAVGLGVAGPLVAQGGRPDPHRRQLEERIRGRFMDQVVRRLDLDAAQRVALDSVLHRGAEERAELADRGRALRDRLMATVANEGATEAEYESLLEAFQRLRKEEWDLQEQEEARLAEVLTARQEAIFLFMRMQFNDRVRGMRGPPGGSPGAGMRPGGGVPPIP